MQQNSGDRIDLTWCLHLKNVRNSNDQSFGEKVKIEGRLVYLIER